MEFKDLPDEKLKATINAEQLFRTYRSARSEADRYAARLSWKRVGDREYLLRDLSLRGARTQKTLGARSDHTEQVMDRYTKQRNAAIDRSKALTAKYETQKKVNKALRLGVAPPIVVDILSAVAENSLDRKFQVIGTNAMYAYAAAAGVVFDDDLLATEDLDLLWDSRSRMTIASPDPGGLLGLIRKVDPSFVKSKDQYYTIENKDGYQVDLIKRHEGFDIDEPTQPWKNEHDFWAVHIKNMDWMLSAPKFTHTIISSNGAMADMVTVDPRAFMLFKHWVSEQPSRDPRKARRDLHQAQAMMALLTERFPHLDVQGLNPFPKSVRDRSERLKA